MMNRIALMLLSFSAMSFAIGCGGAPESGPVGGEWPVLTKLTDSLYSIDVTLQTEGSRPSPSDFDNFKAAFDAFANDTPPAGYSKFADRVEQVKAASRALIEAGPNAPKEELVTLVKNVGDAAYALSGGPSSSVEIGG